MWDMTPCRFNMKFSVFLVFFLAASYANAANILVMSTVLSKSHHMWIEKVILALASEGHNMTVLSHDKKSSDHENYHLLYVEDSYRVAHADHALEDLVDLGEEQPTSMFFDYLSLVNLHMQNSQSFKKLLSYPKKFKFDLILWDIISGENLFPIVRKFGNPPIIALSPLGITPSLSQIMGNNLYSYVPFWMKHYPKDMSLWQRIENAMNMVDFLWSWRSHLKKMRVEATKIFGEDIDDFEDIFRNVSLALVNYDPNFEAAQPVSPNIIPVGGLQVQKPKPLPKDLADLLDNDKKGIIYFSLGTNLQPEKIDPSKLEAFMKCFATLDHTILWKIKDVHVKAPKNVVVRSWMPQNDILAHSSVKLFISHGGLLSSQESLTHGVPLVILPFFGDQYSNMHRYEEMGVARGILFKHLTPEYVCEAIKDVLHNEKYRKEVQKISKRIKSAQNTPLEIAVHWINFVLKNGPAEHLNTPTRYMSLFKALNLDLILVLWLVCTTPLLLVTVWCYRRRRDHDLRVKKTK